MRHNELAIRERWTQSVEYNLIIIPVTLHVNECFLLQRRLFGWKHKEFSHNINQTVKETAAYLVSQTEQWFEIGVLRKRSVRKTKLLKIRGHCLNTLTPLKFSDFYTYDLPTQLRTLFININQLDALNFIISLFQASTCFEHMCSKHVEAWNKLIITFSASSWLILHRTATYRCDDTRDCIIQFTLLTMSTCARNM